VIIVGQLVGGNLREGTFEIEILTGRQNYISGSTNPDLIKGKAVGTLVRATVKEDFGKYTLVELKEIQNE